MNNLQVRILHNLIKACQIRTSALKDQIKVQSLLIVSQQQGKDGKSL